MLPGLIVVELGDLGNSVVDLRRGFKVTVPDVDELAQAGRALDGAGSPIKSGSLPAGL